MIYVLVLLTLAAVVWLLLNNQPSTGEPVTYSTVRRFFVEEKVESFHIKGNTLTVKLKENDDETGSNILTHELYDVAIFYEDNREFIDKMFMSDETFNYNYDVGWQAPWWLGFIPYAVIIVVFVVLWMAMMNRSGVGGDKSVMKFGKARTRLASEEKRKVTFADVAGADEEKAELQEIVDYLKGPQKYIALGARIPKGVLLVGPPGTGKTLLAKAVAGEAGVQFLSISGSDFVELYVGVGASRVRDLFDQAKKLSPAIIFIDEIDAVGRQRGAGLGGGHDEREQTLNQLLVEMDGFTSNEGVIVIAATNRADILDNALLRPGRFDRQIYVGLPDIKGREEILKVHARGKMLGEDVDFKSIARGTPGFTGADLENLLNEAALLAARGGKRFISMLEIEKATLKVLAGPEKKSRVVTEKDRRLTAYHEAGHAVVSYFLEHADPVHHITIIPHGAAGGMTIYRPEEDKSFNSRSEMFERIVSALGGRVAEKLILDDISTGASGDIQQASAIARSMVTKYGMSERLGPISFDSSSHSVFIGRDFSQTKSYSEQTAAIIDEEVKRIFDEAMKRCENILTEKKHLLVATAEYLLENETMTGEEFKYLCEHDGALPPKKDIASDDAGPTPTVAPGIDD
ncbi:MAG TPA: ATP-dependent zinc metalloprotease FtsH [Papillibacter sp.]|nr:ATP-dependent zinc metalloprotease FtsH [Papillibacter sp.]